MLVAGTGLYLRSVTDPMEVPGRWPDVRAELEARVGTEGVEALHRQLASLDPTASSRMEPSNARRVVRALEVTLGSGRPFSSFGPGVDNYPEVHFVQFGLRWPRPLLTERIAERVHRMIDGGLVAEVEALAEGPISRTARQALGYKELLDHLDGGSTLDAAIEMIIDADTPVRGASGTVVPPRPAHTLDRYRRRSGGHGAAGTGTCMAQLELTKHHGLGNDFLVTFHPHVSDLAALARRLCDRRRGIGADGLLIGESEDGFAARMLLFNSDGSRAEMSGNGIRCFAQALARRRGDLSPQRILTDAGERMVTLYATEDPDVIDAAVDMGPVSAIEAPRDWHRVGTDPLRPVSHLSVGNPHAVVGVDDVAVVDLLSLGEIVPDINLEVIEAGPEPHAITMRVHERGAGITQACGTGACASAWAAQAWGFVTPGLEEITVHMDGGDARVRLHHPQEGNATLIGPAVLIGSISVRN